MIKHRRKRENMTASQMETLIHTDTRNTERMTASTPLETVMTALCVCMIYFFVHF